jgi:hypothetical protein
MAATPDFATLAPTARRPKVQPGPAWVYAYVCVQIACQLALLSSTLAPSRVIFRSAGFCTSLLFLALIPGTSKSSLPRTLGIVVMALLTLAAFKPGGGAPLAVVAHLAFHIAILGPLFWVARLELQPGVLQRLLLILWIFHTASAMTGLLQVFFPGQFQPAMTVFIREKQALMIRLSSGEWVPRPMGLSDTPGGVANSGVYASLLGIGVLMSRPFPYARVAGPLSMLIGGAGVFLSQIRSGVVLLVIAFVALVVQLIPSSRIPQLLATTALTVVIAIGAFELSHALAGDTVTDRLRTLLQADSATVYQANRGMMLEYGVKTLLPQYPLGAGLGHWGMIHAYFGRPEDNIGAEIQIVGWIIDGGLPLVIAYSAAVFATIAAAWRIGSRSTDPQYRAWTTIVVAFDVAAVALCFSFPMFMGTSGIEFWLLNAVLLASNPENRPLQAAESPR